MNSKDIISKKKDILFYLSKRQIKNAFNTLNGLVLHLQDWQMNSKLNELETNYKFMLHYLFEGTEDNERDSVYRNLLSSLYEMTDDITDELMRSESSNVFYERLRINELKNPLTISDYQALLRDASESISLLGLLDDGAEKEAKVKELCVKKERVASDMFNIVYISPRANDESLAQYIQFVDSTDIAIREKCLFISAITINIFHRFDSKKVEILMHAAISEHVEIRARAIVGLIVIMQMYDTRWEYYPSLQNRLDVLRENPDFNKFALQIIIQLIRARETEKISKKITEEILPEMMRFNSLAGKKLNIEELLSEADFSDKNPEWKKELEESGLVNKLQEYSNLQLEGADVFHSTFSSLKNFTFFTEMSNWFLPFDITYSELFALFGAEQKSSLLKAAIVDSNQMCNSDKYSFCLSLLQISPAQREMMTGQMGAESEEMKQMQQEAKELNSKAGEETISNQYIQDLYRFFKLNPYRNNFFDIFKLRLNFYDKKSIAPLISDSNSMKQIALFCFDKNNFSEALDIFNLLIKKSEDNNDALQKIGYCKQMLNDLPGALDAYLHADLITPNNSWILKRIAQIYRTLKKPELSLEYYKKAIAITPDNLNLELNIGHCYLEQKDYEKALNSYFKVELLDTKSSKALRPIAWTAFLLKKFDLSLKYYLQILQEKPTTHDYLNLGHVNLCMENQKEAISYYKQAAQKEEDYNQFIDLFEADKDILIDYGVNLLLFPYLYDQIQYEAQK